MQNKLTKEYLSGKISEFCGILKSRGEQGKSPADAKSHFSNWLKKELKDSKKTLLHPAASYNQKTTIDERF